MYRKSRKYREHCAAMRQGKARRRLEGEPRPPPLILPDLRRRITVEDFDHGHVVHVFDLHRTSRIDCYRVLVNGKPWRLRIGWARMLAGLRKSFPRLQSPRDE